MPVIGFTFRTIGGKREKQGFKGEMKVNSKPDIKEVKEIDVPSLGKKALSISFEFITSYEPKIADIMVGGEVLYLGEKNEEVIKEWKKDKKLPEKMNVEILNHLFRKCLLKISYIADDLQLPPPIQLPKIRPKSANQTQSDYIG